MALAQISFVGKSIGLNTAMNVILPDEGPGPFPVFYLLHGLSDDQNAWTRRTSLERYVAGLPLIIVMPTTARGWYTNSASDPRRAYEDHIIKDVVPLVDRIFPTIKERAGRVIGGLSMGGYGAMKLALKYPDMFCSATSHSGAVAPFLATESARREIKDIAIEFQAIFGNAPRGGENDPLALALNCPHNLRPALRIDCGAADALLAQNRELHTLLNSIDYAHEYEEYPAQAGWFYAGPLNRWTGGHDWNYWDFTVQHALVFHCKALGIPLPNLMQKPQ